MSLLRNRSTRPLLRGARVLVVLLGLLGTLGVPFGDRALAFPDGPAELCRLYPDASKCSAGLPACTTCHLQAPPERNVFGAQVEAALAPTLPRPLSTEAFVLWLPEALRAVELLDADEDGFTNLEELVSGSEPALTASIPVYASCSAEEAQVAAGEAYDVCGYDRDYVFTKVSLDFCGRSPTYDEVQAFRALSASEQRQAVHTRLDTCLVSDHWAGPNGVVWNMANDKIRPSASLKSGDTFLGPEGDIPLADYTDDYLLFTYVHTGDRDVRDALLADYFVRREDDGTWTRFSDDPIVEYTTRGFGLAQLVTPSRRAGLITARWFLMANTMFTSVPRTTAAQAYRSYLGYDIAKLEGLYSVANEPVDYDVKDVERQACAVCHATLDPLSYPFTRYEGIGGGDGDGNLGLGNNIPYSYNASRMNRFVGVDGAAVAGTPEAGVLFGQPVADLNAWARVAANSPAFAQNVVREYWEILLGEPPRATDAAEFTTLWRDLMGRHGYRVQAMLHALVDTEAYGVP